MAKQLDPDHESNYSSLLSPFPLLSGLACFPTSGSDLRSSTVQWYSSHYSRYSVVQENSTVSLEVYTEP